MAVIEFPDQVSRILARPDFRGLSAGVVVRVAPDLPASFQVTQAGGVLLHPGCAADAALGTIATRHALELLLLQRLWPALPALAGLAAARTATLFAIGDRLNDLPMVPGSGLSVDYELLAADTPPDPAQTRALWASLMCHQPSVNAQLPSAFFGILRRVWSLLGPAKWLMQMGADPHPATELSGHGYSAHPRSSVVSFASATGCFISERGYGAAEAMRQTLLADIAGNVAAVGGALANVRGVIRTAWGLPPGTFVALAPSSAEAELFALAAAQGHPDSRPVTVVLMAPAEIDEGVAAAAAGRHPAAVTARGIAVEALSLIDGYRGDTEVEYIALRDGNAALRAAEDIDAECAGIAAAAVAAGRRVMLHRLDISRTGLLAPSTAMLMSIRESHPDLIDVVVDASQARLSPDRVWDYLALGWIVMLSGCKFFAGPQSSAAVLVPENLRDRFARKLPVGLRDYSSRSEWPPSLVAAAPLPPGGNVGLALRWAAALAEMNAFNAMSPGEQHRIISEFYGSIRSAVLGNAELLLIEAPPPRRPSSAVSAELTWNGAVWDGVAWDETKTIVSFALRDSRGSGWLSPEAARQIHAQLQANPDAAWAGDSTRAEQAAQNRVFEIGQPVTVAMGGRDIGVLSIAASTRLVSAEPSHAAASLDERLTRAVLDAEIVLKELSLILRQ